MSLISPSSSEQYVFERKKITLEQLEKAKTAKREFNLLESRKKSMEKRLDETFKPITNPLRKSVKLSNREF